jgi:chromosome segregation ATPase
MQRVYAVVREEIVHLIDDRAKVMGITRSLWISKAIDSFLQLPGDDRVTSGDGRVTQGDDLITSGDDKITSGDDRIIQEVTTLRAKLDESIAEADHLRGDLLVKEGDLAKLKTDAELKWRETTQLRAEITQARRELETARNRAETLQIELDKKKDETEQARSKAEAIQKDLTHYQDTVRLKDQHISFLEATVHQALEKLPKAIPPSEEEAKKKGWWQFWK